MLAPQQAAVALRKGCHRIADRAHQRRVLRVLHVQRRAHVQHAGVHVAEHAVLQAVTVQQCAELGNVFRQVLGGHGRVFDEGLRSCLTLHVAQQAHGTLAHGIDALDGVRSHRQRVAQTAHGGVGLQVIHEALNARVHLGRVIAAEFHQVDAQGLLAFLLRKIFRHAVPDEIVHGQQQHLGIHRLDGQGLLRDQCPGVAQRIHEGGIAHVHQHRILRDGQHVEPRLHHEAQRTLGAAQHAVEIEAAVRTTQVRQVIAGQAAVELRKLRTDEIGLLVGNAAGRAVNLADAPGLRTQCFQSRIIHRLADEALAAQQHVVQRQHVVARLAVGAAALAAGVGVDHAAQRRPVGGGQLGGKEEAVRAERGVELVLHHAGLGTHPAFLGVDLQNAVHVPRQVHHQPVGE